MLHLFKRNICVLILFEVSLFLDKAFDHLPVNFSSFHAGPKFHSLLDTEFAETLHLFV